jgi:hypothetical protein
MEFVAKKPDLQPSRRGSFWCALGVLFSLLAGASAQTSAPLTKAVGTVKSIDGNSLVLTTDAGADLTVTLADSARILRALPGQTDLKGATPVTVSDIHIGDRVLARGQAGEGNTVVASSAIVMARSDITDRQQREREEWRKGVGGIVKEVNASAGTVSIANALAASGRPIVIHVAADATIRRYAPNSVKFDDAKPGALDQIKPGDQLRARGIKNADGTEFTAQAVVSGTFHDMAGTVVSTDAASNRITVIDLATKKPIVVKVSSDSQLRRLPPQVAMMIAMRLKGGTPGAVAGKNAEGGGQPGAQGGGPGNWRGPGNGSGSAQSVGSGASGSGASGTSSGGNWRGNGGGLPDFQTMISRMPAVSVTDLQKGDAVILVATEGSSDSGPTAITLLAGVDPILTAAPAGMQASTILSPWNLGTSAGAVGDASTP